MKLSIITATHNPKFLPETWASVRSQTHNDWEWVVVCTDNDGRLPVAEGHAATVRKMVEGDPRVRVSVHRGKFRGVGERKNHAFGLGTGEALIELDHDDLLTPDCLDELDQAFRDPAVGFVYSDFADFEHGAVGQGNPSTYRLPDSRAGWENNGFRFYNKHVLGVRPGLYECVQAFEPSAAMCSLVFWAPNHVRAWRRSVYHEVGGHDIAYPLADDHELLMRTYIATTFVRIRKPLYLYRVHTNNTWSQNVPKIRELSFKARNQHLEGTILAECKRLGLPAFDLGGAFNGREGWQPVDIEPVDGGLQVDLRERWPWADNSVGAFRAIDLLEHLPNKLHTMSEMHRCLRPGGWAITFTPSTDGRGAFMDPTHVSYWNEPAFWYWTRAEQAAYIRNKTVRFQAHVLHTELPSDWHRDNNIPYVRAVLVALKPDYHPPGEVLI
jgi:glycosyltransferase involved in cell wall biosynthesis